jgi:hypothetical protein
MATHSAAAYELLHFELRPTDESAVPDISVISHTHRRFLAFANAQQHETEAQLARVPVYQLLVAFFYLSPYDCHELIKETQEK